MKLKRILDLIVLTFKEQKVIELILKKAKFKKKKSFSIV